MANDEIFSKQCELIASAFPHLVSDMNEASRETESPIEALLVSAATLWKYNSECHEKIWMLRERVNVEGFLKILDLRLADEKDGENWVYAAPQVSFDAERRCDFMFAIYYKRWHLVCVECDGFEWHDKDKASFEKYRCYDRLMQQSGINVLRFAGTEIWRDAAGCLAQIILYLRKLVDDAHQQWMDTYDEISGRIFKEYVKHKKTKRRRFLKRHRAPKPALSDGLLVLTEETTVANDNPKPIETAA